MAVSGAFLCRCAGLGARGPGLRFLCSLCSLCFLDGPQVAHLPRKAACRRAQYGLLCLQVTGGRGLRILRRSIGPHPSPFIHFYKEVRLAGKSGRRHKSCQRSAGSSKSPHERVMLDKQTDMKGVLASWTCP